MCSRKWLVFVQYMQNICCKKGFSSIVLEYRNIYGKEGIDMEVIKPYFHKVQYYETDAMEVVHHSDYIRWFEEARMDFLEQAHFPYQEIEAQGILVPVLEASCKYRQAVRFGEIIQIEAMITKFTGVKFMVSYQVYDEKHEVLHATGNTAHCFLNQDFAPISIKRHMPELYEFLMESCKKGAAQ